MNKFHILYRYNDELVSSSEVIEAEDIVTAIEQFQATHEVPDSFDMAFIDEHQRGNFKEAHIIAVHTQELVNLMASSRG